MFLQVLALSNFGWKLVGLSLVDVVLFGCFILGRVDSCWSQGPCILIFGPRLCKLILLYIGAGFKSNVVLMRT